MFVNLLKNAEEANASTLSKELSKKPKETTINWWKDDNFIHIEVSDQGAGISNHDNLFVPFYTTKKQGSGIGLTLSRQIALNHGGDLRLVNIKTPNTNNVMGAKAILSLPVSLQSVIEP